MKHLIAFLKATFSEPDGTPSSTRVLGGTTVASTLLWITYLVIRTKQLPDLGGASLFISAGFSGYAANKVSGAFNHGKDEGK